MDSNSGDNLSLLLQRASNGDSAALATLLLEYQAELLKYINRRLPAAVKSITDPEDIIQETSFEACRMIRGFVPGEHRSFYRWLVRIANFRIKSACQRYRARRTGVISEGVGEDASVLNALSQLSIYRRTPSASAAMHEFAAKLEQALNRLIPDYRQVLVHRFIEGLSPDEIAGKMNRTSNQIYVLNSRALGALRGQLASASHYA